jgi:hypothetical protein
MDLSFKSTGALIDEYLTSELKVKANNSLENVERNKQLNTLVKLRVRDRYDVVGSLVLELQMWLRQCWDAQEVVMKYKGKAIHNLTVEELYQLGSASLLAQNTNAERCRVVREIDKALGESDRTYLEKTYA